MYMEPQEVRRCQICHATEREIEPGDNVVVSICPMCHAALDQDLNILLVVENARECESLELNDGVMRGKMRDNEAKRTGQVVVINDYVFREVLRADPPECGVSLIDESTAKKLAELCGQTDDRHDSLTAELNDAAEASGYVQGLEPGPSSDRF